MAEKLPIFTVDWEDFYHAVNEPMSGHSSLRETDFILDILEKYGVKAIFYCLGQDADCEPELVRKIEGRGHVIGSHGWHHSHNEKLNDYYDRDCRGLLRVILGKNDETFPYRSPYWDTTPMPQPPSGGFFFRFMPFWYVKWAVKKSGVFWIHPHDLDEDHPRLKNPLLNWKRHVGLRGARAKLDRLLSEVQFSEP